jgi:tetratricopeptide (TPR) repeat protein
MMPHPTRCLALAGWLLVTAAVATAQWTPFKPDKLTRIQSGIREIYSLDYDGAIRRFEEMKRESPDDPTGYAYLAFAYWIRELNSKQEMSIDRFAASDFFAELPKHTLQVDPPVEQQFRNASQEAIDRAEARLKRDPRDPEARYLLGLAQQNLTSFEASLKQSWKAAFSHGRETYAQHSGLLREYPDFGDARLATGVYNYVLGSLNWFYKFVVFLLGQHGSKEQGKKDLSVAAEKGVLAADDARLMLVLIYTREKDYAKAVDLLAQVYKRYPQNYLLPLDMGGLALLQKQPDRAIEIYREVLKKHEAGSPRFNQLEAGSIQNRLAVAFREKRDFAGSLGWSEKAVAGRQGSERTRTLAHLEMAKTLDLMGRRPEALKHYEMVAAAEDVAGSRLEAQEWLKQPFAGR